MKMKRESDGNHYLSGAYLHVPDKRKPSKWDIRFKEITNGKCRVTRRALDQASIAFSPMASTLHPIRISLHEQARIKKSLISLYRSMGVSESEIPSYLCEFTNDTGETVFEGRMTIQFEGSVFDEHVERKQFNKETGVLANLAMLSPKSMNHRRYLPAVMESAVKKGVYEGAPCFINHTDKISGRSLYDLAGHWQNVKYDPISERIRGDLNSMRQHRELIFDVVENAPEQAAPSHVAGVLSKKVRDGSGQMIEDITNIAKCFSVDIVVGAATIGNIKEGIEMGDIAKATLESLQKERPDLYEAIRLDVKDGTPEAKSDENQREFKALYESEKKAKENAEKRATEVEEEREKEKKAFESSKFLDVALDESPLPDPAKEMIRAGMKDKVMTEAEAKKVVSTQVEYLEKVTGKKLEKVAKENKATLPTNENRTGAGDEKTDKQVLSETLCTMGGLKVEEKEKKD